jgi:transcriptional regulator with XRE-family HTH domain
MFKNRLSKLIKERKITQTELARALGVHRQNVYQWTAGKTKPRPDEFKRVAQYFGVTVDYLLKDDEDTDNAIFGNGNIVASNSSNISSSVNAIELTPQEQELLRMFRKLSVREQTEALAEFYKKEEDKGSASDTTCR